MKLQKITLFLFTFLTIISFSQTEKGTYYIGANSNFNFSTSSSDFKSENAGANNINKNTQIKLSGEIGYLIVDKLVSGLEANYSSLKEENNNDNTGFLTISPFVKYYFSDTSFKPFARLSYGFGKVFKEEGGFYIYDGNNYISTDSKTSINKLNAGGGIAYFFNNYISVEFILNYFEETYTNKFEHNNSESKSIVSGISSSIGFSIFL